MSLRRAFDFTTQMVYLVLIYVAVYTTFGLACAVYMLFIR